MEIMVNLWFLTVLKMQPGSMIYQEMNSTGHPEKKVEEVVSVNEMSDMPEQRRRRRRASSVK